MLSVSGCSCPSIALAAFIAYTHEKLRSVVMSSSRSGRYRHGLAINTRGLASRSQKLIKNSSSAADFVSCRHAQSRSSMSEAPGCSLPCPGRRKEYGAVNDSPETSGSAPSPRGTAIWSIATLYVRHQNPKKKKKKNPPIWSSGCLSERRTCGASSSILNKKVSFHLDIHCSRVPFHRCSVSNHDPCADVHVLYARGLLKTTQIPHYYR